MAARLPRFMNDWSRFVLRVTRDAILLADESRFLFVNRGFEELCDSASAELVENPSLLMPPMEHAEFFQLVQRHLALEAAVPDAIVECLNKTSGPFLARVSFHPFVDPTQPSDTDRKCLLCIFSEPLFYKPLFETTSNVILLLEYWEDEHDLALLKANQTAERLLNNASPSTGGRQKLLLQKQLGFCFEEDDLFYLSQQRAVGVPHAKLFVVSPPSAAPGVEIYLAATISYLGRSLKGRSLFTFTADDITEVSQLKLQVQEGKRFIQAQSTFFAKMVHELRSPLSGMLDISALLRHTLLSTDQADLVHTLQTCGDSLLTLVGNLLDLSNLERNNIVLAYQPFDLLDCIEDTLDIAAVSASKKNIELMYEVGRLPSRAHK
jgi:hypothetical protein